MYSFLPLRESSACLINIKVNDVDITDKTEVVALPLDFETEGGYLVLYARVRPSDNERFHVTLELEPGSVAGRVVQLDLCAG